MNLFSKLGQFLTGAQAQAASAADQVTQAAYVIIGLLLVGDILLAFIFLHATRRRT